MMVRLPTKAAQIAIKRNLATSPDSQHYKEVREQSRRIGWPQLILKNAMIFIVIKVKQ
jgi:hypothetical protein